MSEAPPEFDEAFRADLETLIRWRRDVRKFRTDPIDPAEVDALLEIATRSPSVGNSQPWRFVVVEDPASRAAVRANFEVCNADALSDFEGEKAKLYASLKLSGLDDAPVHIAVFFERDPAAGAGLGRKTMPEAIRDSVAFAVQTFALAARARGIGVGMVTILDPEEVARILAVPDDWELFTYACVGYPAEVSATPELERLGWQERLDLDQVVTRR